MSSINVGRVLLAVSCVLTALVVQATVLARIGLPGATPDLVIVVVLALAMSSNPMVGAVIGFSAGLVADLAPAAGGSLGQSAALYALAGFAAGHLQPAPGSFDLSAIGAISGLATAVVLGQALLGTFFGGIDVSWARLPWLLATEFAYCAILAAALLPIIGVLYRGAGEEGRFA